MNYTYNTTCRVCGSARLSEYLDLGFMPLSNNLCTTQDEEPERYPLKVLLCENCGLSQLSIVVDPKILFGHYVYRSSISKGYVDHCNKMALDLKAKYKLNEDSFVIDIAGNDGALLHEFKKVIGCKVLNVDPAENLVPINDAKGIRIYNTFWGYAAASHLQRTDWPKADVITATNVFAHVDDVKEFLEAVKMAIKPEGVLILEFPYLVDTINNLQFDQIYFEHLSYFSIGALRMLCDEVGLGIMHVEKQDIHGGSVRVTIGHGDIDDSAYAYQLKEIEGNFDKIQTYYHFASQVRFTIELFAKRLSVLSQCSSIAAFGASAKGNTLLNCAGVTCKEIGFIIDETPEKLHKFSPGTGIQICSIAMFALTAPAYVVLLAWNFRSECIQKCRAAGYTGKFILPLTFEIVDA